ncbi:visual pigment-like receptor peropsin [Melitaea cinxia]|uniref:visual pigment-like receptor peropsin n=1 Tax=Melitaea cinxia TaxID=113334 RepID=UPI001E270979|nr:visual pigment-like receptor peropsin [Melitaea cinxia]
MQTLIDYNEDDCPWYYFDSSYKTLLGACLIVFGVFGVLLNAWLYATFIHSHLVIFKSHVLVLNLCTASLGRNLLGFPFAGSSAIAKRWLFGPACCQLFAFMNQFFGVFQMIALFAIVLERYLLARYYRRERNVYFRYYWTLIGVCWMVAVIFAAPPLFGYGMYSCDSTGTVCALLWPSLNSGARQLGFSVPYVIVCGILPIFGIFFFMGKSIRLERIYYRSEQQREERRFTKCIHVVCIITLALWIPAAVLAGWQWLPLLFYGYRPHVPQVLALFAPIAAEAATSVPVLCYLASDERLRAALLGRMRKHYALLHPERAKRYRRSIY